MSETFLKVVKFTLSLLIFVLFILCIIWLTKVYSNADDEPSARLKYISEEIFSYDELYNPGDFCYEHYESYIAVGAFEDLDIRMKKIRKYSLALLITFLISFIISILDLIMIIGGIFLKCAGKVLQVISIIFGILNILASLLSLIFFIILSVYYFKSNFDDFEDFNECRYLNTSFDYDYDFVYVVKKNYKRFFIVFIIVFVLNIIDSLLQRILNKRKAQAQS